jgi:hypothetical protein
MEGSLLCSQACDGRTYHWAKTRWWRRDGSHTALAVGYLGPGDLVINLDGQQLSPAVGATLAIDDGPHPSIAERPQ